MADYDYGPIQTYEITWKSGYIETIQSHQVTWQGGASGLGALFDVAVRTGDEERVRFHGQLDGHWRLMLDAPAADIATIRNTTHDDTVADILAKHDQET